ncbi:IS21 family transposase [Streptomyces phaeochromogenes]|uniref:IS21 family transposase n=1 Tax=Streptomyces phaeochromogenes TaxID=1923 RepID=UPI003F4D30A1
MGWRTVQRALSSAWPQSREPYAPRRSKLDPFKPVIDQMLLADLDAPREQRHTVVRIYRRLINEHAMDDVSYQVVRAYVAKRKPEIRVEAGRGPAQVFIEQSHLAGAEAEVDFGEVSVRLRGVLVKCHLFCLRLSFSGKAVHRVFASGGQEAFFEGHEHAFSVLGGVPFGRIRYDNLKAAVASVLGFTRRRAETDRWTAFRSHYGIEPFYCTPGIEGAHEKGGVEGQIGWFRRNHFVPVPGIDSLAHLNTLIDEWDLADEARRIGTRPRTIGELFAVERPSLKPLPVETFETGRWFTPRVDRFSQITVRTNRYSVPTRFIGRQVLGLLHASELVVFDGRTEIAQHERLLTKSGSRLELEALLRKPGALPGATVLEQARAAGQFTPIHEAW